MTKRLLFGLTVCLALSTSLRATTFTVINTNASGGGSLQQAILDANASAGADFIAFNIASGGLTISPTNALPSIVEPVTIDGRTQPGFASAPIIELNGASAGAAVDGIKINTSNCVISALVINRFLGDQIEITNGANNTVEGCYLGLNLAGTVDASTGLNGILITNAANNIIGGLGSTNRNFISGNNQSGVAIGGASSVSNSILGNVIGLNVTNNAVVNTTDGIRVNAPFTIIGGNSSAARNIISGNTGDGIETVAPLGANMIVQGNWIGLDLNGVLDRGNSANGILAAAGASIIGGSSPGQGNLISGNNDDGIELNGVSSTNHIVLGNIIGSESAFAAAVINSGNGILITTSSRSNVIGGILAGEANTIYFNGGDGIGVAAANANTNNAFRGNLIFGNIASGIDLGAAGITANDNGDADVGANQLQNFPVLTSVSNTATDVFITGTLNSRPSTTYAIDFYSSIEADTTLNGEGQFYIGSTNLSTAADSNLAFTVSFPLVLQGRHVSATATDPSGNTSEFSAAAASVSFASSQTFTVVNTNDSGAGSLREAINQANLAATTGADAIQFAITNLSTTISPSSELPAITDRVTIDGYTQPGAAVNTSATVFNGTVLVRIAGASAGSGANGITITTSSCTVRGLMITGFVSTGADGVEISGGGNNLIEGCLIGIDAAGTDQGNGANGIFISDSPNNVIGGTTPAARNVISGNQSDGVEINGAGATGNQVLGNLIGTGLTGIGSVPNSADGVLVTGAGGNVIGGSASGAGNLISGNSNDGIELTGASTTNITILGNRIGTEVAGATALANSVHGVNINTSSRSNVIGGVLAGYANTIAFNGQDGVNIAAAAANTNNVIRGNSIFSNGTVSGELGIDLGAANVTANDLGDPDTGANQLQNFPVLASVTNTPGGTIFSGSLNSRPSLTYAIDFYANLASDTDGSGEGQFYLGTTNLTTAADSNVTFTVLLPVVSLPGRYITATATDPFGNTSEFATNVYAQSIIAGATYTVVNTNDSGAGSLRQAILDANANISAGDTIAFAITNLTTTISPSSTLPTVTDIVTIDGYTQAGAAVNNSATIFNGTVLVRIAGAGAGSGANGLTLAHSNCVVRGLTITGFTGAAGDGIEITGSGNTVTGCLIGIDSAGSDQGNAGNGIFISGGANNVIGGALAAARNVISGNNGDGIEINGAGARSNQVLGNLIGSGLDGTADVGNGADGVLVTVAGANIIGGANSGEGNLISGNGNDGIELSGLSTTNTIVRGNRIGTTSGGTTALLNGVHGVNINTSSRSNIIGGIVSGQANIIAFNTQDGVNIAAATANTNNTIRGNSIFSNGTTVAHLGIELGADGILTNDAGDADTGANQLQNNPVLAWVTNTPTETIFSGSLNSLASTTYAIDFYANAATDLSGSGEGQVYLGSTNLATDGGGNLNFTIALPVSPLPGRYITATATDPSGNTSEFGTNVFAQSTIVGTMFTVVNTNDSGAGSLRQAILDANVNISAGDTIAFAITNVSKVIFPATALPTITDPVTVDGYTQPGSATNTSATAFNGTLVVKLDGFSAPSGTDGLKFTIGNNTVRGLVIMAFLGSAGDGLDFSGGHSNVVQGNIIGIDADGTLHGNGGDAVHIVSSSGNVIGGSAAGQRNVLSGNGSYGVDISGTGSSGNQILGNLMGTALTGDLALPNSGGGVSLTTASNTTVGGSDSGARNVISGNSGDGIDLLSGSAGTLIQGNYIGTDATGMLDLGNAADGIVINASSNSIVTGNTISGNQSDGLTLTGVNALNNTIQNNLIGTDKNGTSAIANNVAGINITSNARFNTIGGIGAGNTIAFNLDDGIAVASGTNNSLRANSIHSNGSSDLGIDLGTTGITANDVGDTDTGANQLQNFPVLTLASNSLSGTIISGALDSATNAAFVIDFYSNHTPDSSGNGQGEVYLGSTSILTDGSGHADFLASFPTTLTGRFVTATATDTNGNTSEFSAWTIAVSTIPVTNLVVTTTNDSGAGSLRQAIEIANSFISAGADTISFAIPGAGIHAISVTNPLPSISDPVTIDGYTQPGASPNTHCASNNAVIKLALVGSNAPSASGLTLSAFGNISVRGLAIHGFYGNGISINNGTNHQVAGCYLGVDASGLLGSVGNVGSGVAVVGPNTSANRIGGENAADRNVISANASYGVYIGSSSSNIVAGNFIGTDASGTLDRGNEVSGVQVIFSSSVGNVIGGITGCSRNIISGNGAFTFADHYGVELYSAVGTRVLGNYIGLDVTGTQSLGNGSSGVRLRGASFNYIGDGTPAGRNIISGNTAYGVELELTSPTNVIVGNYIGTDVTGALDRGNLFYGVFVGGASYNLILGNVISGNDNHGLYVAGNTSPGNRILGNFIGVSASGGNALGNLGSGVVVDQSSTQVGGTNVNEGNIIAFNEDDGVLIFSGDVNSPVLGNSIYSNGDLGIDLNGNGVTLNDAGDGDSGANNLQNYPVLLEAIRYPGQTIVTATLNSLSNTSYRIEVFNNATNDLSGFGEGQTYLGFTNVTTDGSGNVAFAFTHPAALAVNDYLTATATDTNNNTSEFSAARRIVAYDSVDLAVSIADSADPAPHATNLFYTITVTNSGPTNATSVFVTNTLPPTATFVNATPSQGSASHTAGIVTWNVGAVNDNAGATLTVQVSTIITGLVTNNALVVAAQSDNTPANNTDSETTFLGLADLSVSIVDSPDPVTAGQTVTFTVTVTNQGPDAATGTTLNFDVDYNFVVTGGSISQGALNGFGNNIFATIGTVSGGGNATLSVTATPIAEGTNNNHYSSSSALEADPNLANSSASASTTVNPGPGVFEFTSSSTTVNENGGNATLTVQRLGGSIGTVTVNYATSNLTALAGSDFTATTGILTFTNGETLKTILVPINNDVLTECNETFIAHLFNPAGGAIVLRTTNISVLIFDNEVSASGTILAISSTDTNLPPDAGNNNSLASSVSADGRYVVFSSDANNLVSTDFNFNRDVFVRDLLTQTTALVSRRTGSSFSGNGSSEGALISGNGRYVVFSSYASIFADDDNNSTQDVFVRDLVSLTTTLVSRNVAGTDSGNDVSFTSLPYRTLISSNGQSIVYGSYASDLTTVPDSNVDSDVFFYDRLAGTNRLISRNLFGTGAGNGTSDNPVVSANGLVVAFASTASDLVALPDSNGGEDVFAQNLPAGTNELISVNLSGSSAANGLSGAPYLNADGRYVVFQSSASNLAANDSNTRTDVFRRDRVAGITVLVSVNTNGVAGNSSSNVRGISADGRYVVFSSTSSDLVAGDYNSTEDVFVRDMVANVTILVSRTPGGDPGNSTSRNPVISGDGSHVAFESYATDLTGATKSDFYTDIFVRNLTNNTMRLVSFRNGGTNGPNGDSFDAAISFNGNVTSFTGDPEGGGGGETITFLSGSINYSDVWAHTYASNKTELVSVAAPSSTGNGYSYEHQISASGAHIVFSSYAENLAPGDTNENSDVFLFNLTNGTVSIISMISSNTGTGDGYSDVPDVSASGRYVAFYSTSTNLVTGDNNDAGDLFRRDTVAGTTALVRVNSSGSGPGSSGSFDPDITPDGRFITFETTATNLVANDLNGVIDDIVLRDMTSNVVELITVNAAGTGTANSVSYDPVISDNGRFVAYESFATNLGPTDLNSRYDVYVRDRQLGTNLLCSRNLAGTDGGSEDSYDPIISGNGQVVVFYSYATNLVTGDTNGTGDIFAFNTTTHTRQLVSVALGGGVANNDSFNPSISTDGRYVTFQSYATNLVANDSNGDISDIFVRDLLAGTTTLISGNCNGLGGGNDGSYAPSISGDGRYITFQSAANDLVGGFYSQGVENIYRHDRISGQTVLVSQNRFISGGANGNSQQARISSNGGAISFVSSANNLVAVDANNSEDIFAWQGNLVASGVDLVLTKTASTSSVAQSSGFSYTLTVTNYGLAGATGVVVTDPLPAGVSFASATSSQGTVTNSSGTVIATVGSLAANAGASITINVTAITAGSTSNYASATSIESDASPANNADEVIVTVTAFAPPLLSIQPTNSTQIFVSWPASTPSSFLLETTTNLVPVIVWTPVTNSVSTSGTNKFVILNVNAAEPERYYRLKQ